MEPYAEALEDQLALLRFLSTRRLLPADEHIVTASEGAQFRHKELWDAERDIAAGLERAVPFWWRPELSRLLDASAGTMPNVILSLEMLPAPHGYFRFSEPLPGVALNVFYDGTPTPWEPIVPALAWSLKCDAQQRRYVTVTEMRPVDGHRYGVPAISGDWCVGEHLRDAASTFSHNAVALQVLKRLASAWAFIQQAILAPEPCRVPRHAAARLKRSGYTPEPVVRVIQLRRKTIHTGGSRDGVATEWSCQWVVRGHWRQQFYPSKHANAAIWITPYVKGPADKPLRPPRAAVFAVVR